MVWFGLNWRENKFQGQNNRRDLLRIVLANILQVKVTSLLAKSESKQMIYDIIT